MICSEKLFDQRKYQKLVSRSIYSLGLICDLLWSDPDRYEVNNWGHNERGISCVFNSSTVKNFTEKFDIDLVVRAHQVVEEGYEFFADKRLVTVFSAPNYCGEFDNNGGVLYIDEDLKCFFKIIKPLNKSKKFSSAKNRSATPPKKS